MLDAGEMIFMPLPMRKKSLIPVPANQYIIVEKSGETKQIEAETAYQAFKLSGVKDAIKIERMSNMRSLVVKQKHFIDDNQVNANFLAEETSPFQEIRKRRNPIVSADDMFSLMKSFHKEDEIITKETVSEAIGREVHGDGFDEIIPATQPEKPVAKKTAFVEAAEVEPIETAPKEEAKTEQPSEPEKPLSQEEIEKLLKGD